MLANKIPVDTNSNIVPKIMKHSKHHGHALKQLLDLHKMEVAELAQLLRDEISSLSTVYKLLESETISKARLCLICALFNESPTWFGLPEDYFNPVVAPKKQQEQKRLVIHNYTKERDLKYDVFVREYFKTFDEYMLRATKSIFVLDYIASKIGLSLKDNIGSYNDYNAAFFRKLEDHIQKQIAATNTFEYVRVFQLPLKAFSHEDSVTLHEKVKFIVEALFKETFEHLWYAFHIFEKHFKVYVIQNPVRLFSYYIADESYILSEYLRFDKYGTPIPDILFADSVNEPGGEAIAKPLIEAHITDIRHLIQEKQLLQDQASAARKRISMEVFKYCTITRRNELQNEVRQIEDELKEKQKNIDELIVQRAIAIEKEVADMTMPDEKQEYELIKQRDQLLLEHQRLQAIFQNMEAKVQIVLKQPRSL